MSVSPDPSEVFTIGEAHRYLRIGRSTLYDLCRRGKVPHRRLPGAPITFTRADLDAILRDAYRPAVV